MSPNHLNTTKVMLLMSGGLDSAACLVYYLGKSKSEISSLFIDYGQTAAQEESRAVQAICHHYGVKLNIISVSGVGKFGKGLIIGRNAFLLNTALMFFENIGGIIAIGIHAGTGYNDCTKDFLVKSQNLFDLYTDGRIVIDAPFIEWSKLQIWEFCSLKKIPVELTYSCEAGGFPQCGDCLSCRDMEVLRGKR